MCTGTPAHYEQTVRQADNEMSAQAMKEETASMHGYTGTP